jgi:hypothetical protein
VQSPPLYFTLIEAIPVLADILLERWKAAEGPRKSSVWGTLVRVTKAMRMQARVFPAAEPEHHLWTGHLRWHQGQARKAVRSWERARDTAVRLRMPYEEALALVALASSRDAADPERAMLTERAREIFIRLGAEHDLARVGAPLDDEPRRANGARRAPSSRRRGSRNAKLEATDNSWGRVL